MRWVERRARLAHHVLNIVIGLLPEQLARCVAEVGAVRARLETDAALRALRTLPLRRAGGLQPRGPRRLGGGTARGVDVGRRRAEPHVMGARGFDAGAVLFPALSRGITPRFDRIIPSTEFLG